MTVGNTEAKSRVEKDVILCLSKDRESVGARKGESGEISPMHMESKTRASSCISHDPNDAKKHCALIGEGPQIELINQGERKNGRKERNN